MRLTKKQIEQIKELHKQGKNQVEIMKALGVTQSQVCYWRNPITRLKNIEHAKNYFNNLSPERKREIINSKKGYIKRYRKKRYNQDAEFRERVKKISRESNYKYYHLKKKNKGID